MLVVPVILSGGSGSRLWPVSRKLYPKQFLPLDSEKSMFQETIIRLREIKFVDVTAPLIVCNQEHRFLVSEQMQEICTENLGILLEPDGRNTAPAITLAAIYAKKKLQENVALLVLPADQRVKDKQSLAKTIDFAIESMDSKILFTFGVKPTQPHTGYGYIKKGSYDPQKLSFDVEAFIEKPDHSTAVSFLKSSDYLWNSGMFLFESDTYLELLEKSSPNIILSCKAALQNTEMDMGFTHIDADSFLQSPTISVDHAVMEKAVDCNFKIKVFPIDIGWNDLGTWASLLDVGDQDKTGNVTDGEIFMEDTNNSYLSIDKGILATIGISNLIIVRTADALLVADREKSHNVNLIVERLKDRDREEVNLHRKVTRPWGTYECLDESDTFKVKRIIVKPGAKLSVQMHKFRSEHWVIVKGEATVTIGEETKKVRQNESVYIPVETKHSLENQGTELLELIEVQNGSYLGEDDIIRFEDRYGRKDKNGNQIDG